MDYRGLNSVTIKDSSTVVGDDTLDALAGATWGYLVMGILVLFSETIIWLSLPR